MFWLLMSTMALARQVDGIEFPETATVGGVVLPLNGVGIRERYFFDIYAVAIGSDVCKRIDLRFVYRHVTRQQAVDALRWRLMESPAAASIKDQVETFVGWLGDFDRGDEIVFDYAPGVGTTVRLKGEAKGMMPGAAFMRTVWSIFLGESPITESLKRGMLGK
jgi:hypothetical protein